jgi:type IV secretion system protein VirB9
MKKEVEKQEVQTELNRTAIPRNWDYYMNINPESENISPSFAYDDGQFTYLGFDSTKDIPSVFLYENEKESILNNHIKKEGNYDVLVIQKTAKQIVLRSGKRIVGILNKSFGVNPLEQQKTTNSPKLEREVINGK